LARGDIEEVYLEEDGSIQFLVTWKPSLIAMENLVGEELWPPGGAEEGSDQVAD
jgi:hypothetical protein